MVLSSAPDKALATRTVKISAVVELWRLFSMILMEVPCMSRTLH